MSEPVESGTIRTRAGVEIAYEIHGAGPPMVFVAGLGDDRNSWAGQVPEFARDHKVVLFDNRGIGQSATPPGPYSIEQMADDAHDLARALKLEPVIAVGSSMGGAICQQWALRHPEDIKKLVITNSWAERDVFMGALVDHWMALAKEGQSQHILESLLLFCFSPGYLARKPETVKMFLETPAPPMDGFAAAAAACRGHHTLDRAAEIRHPALVVAGEFDILTRPELSQHLAQRMKQARYASLPTAHMVFWEMPDEFNRLVRGFVEG
ncbi:lipolytic protein [Hypericibacter adhaerens]|jgi:pimeloyl-ACP methyl ester carboxylesterase|uniref:Lipolytic protein n=1 Tax=Hypericibacter adhaerens TaxID=2602016 RepID=A0A5J6N2I2_9PROT|nr:alpha/beta hydrolase [Hypericibacter adhaerens]QEX24162.1 lipolytic protein [Hypericibacter adhaerens]